MLTLFWGTTSGHIWGTTLTLINLIKPRTNHNNLNYHIQRKPLKLSGFLTVYIYFRVVCITLPEVVVHNSVLPLIYLIFRYL